MIMHLEDIWNNWFQGVKFTLNQLSSRKSKIYTTVQKYVVRSKVTLNQGSRLQPFFESASKNLTWLHLCECIVCAAPKRLLHTAHAAELRHIVAGVRLHWSREERRFQRERFSRTWFILTATARARRCATEEVVFKLK